MTVTPMTGILPANLQCGSYKELPSGLLVVCHLHKAHVKAKSRDKRDHYDHEAEAYWHGDDATVVGKGRNAGTQVAKSTPMGP